MKVWGLTGNIACGKSAVERSLRKLGVSVIDADVTAREVVAPGTEGLAAVVDAFGPEILDANGALDRRALGTIVFADADARERLESITHPLIFGRMGALLAALSESGVEIAVVSAALMVESGSFRNYAGLAVVTCPPALQLARLRARDGSTEAAARARIDAQLDQAEKVAKADVVLDNSGHPDSLEAQVAAWAAADLLAS